MATRLKHAEADGYTLGFSVSSTFYLNPLINDISQYGVGDFTYVAAPAEVQLAVVAQNDKSWENLDDMAEYARQNGGISIAVQAQELRLAAERIAEHYGIEVRILSTKGGAGSLAKILGGHVDLGILAGPQVPYVKSGEIVELAMLTEKRSPYSPNTMTLKEQGIEWGIENYFQFTAPKGLSPAVTTIISDAIDDAMQTSELQELAGERLHLGIERTLGPADLDRVIQTSYQTLKNELGTQ